MTDWFFTFVVVKHFTKKVYTHLGVEKVVKQELDLIFYFLLSAICNVSLSI